MNLHKQARLIQERHTAPARQILSPSGRLCDERKAASRAKGQNNTEPAQIKNPNLKSDFITYTFFFRYFFHDCSCTHLVSWGSWSMVKAGPRKRMYFHNIPREERVTRREPLHPTGMTVKCSKFEKTSSGVCVQG